MFYIADRIYPHNAICGNDAHLVGCSAVSTGGICDSLRVRRGNRVLNYIPHQTDSHI